MEAEVTRGLWRRSFAQVWASHVSVQARVGSTTTNNPVQIRKAHSHRNDLLVRKRRIKRTAMSVATIGQIEPVSLQQYFCIIPPSLWHFNPPFLIGRAIASKFK